MNKTDKLIENDQLDDILAQDVDIFSIIPGHENSLKVPVVKASELTEKEFASKWVDENKPCLIKGAVENWPAVEKWKNKDYWLTNCEDFKVAMYPHMNHNRLKMQKMIGDEQMPFHDAISRIFENTDPVVSIPGEEITENNKFSDILKDLGQFSFLKNSATPRVYERRRFFIYRRAATAWHYHSVDETLLCQINGSKKVMLLPPKLPRPKYVSKFLFKELYLTGERLDETLDLKPIIAEVEQGDALYIPPYWHHGVVPADREIGFTLSYCWRSPLHILGDLSNYFVWKLYQQGLWPLKKVSLLVPILAIGASFSFYKRRMFNRY